MLQALRTLSCLFLVSSWKGQEWPLQMRKLSSEIVGHLPKIIRLIYWQSQDSNQCLIKGSTVVCYVILPRLFLLVPLFFFSPLECQPLKASTLNELKENIGLSRVFNHKAPTSPVPLRYLKFSR